MAQHPFTTAYASDLERAVTLANGVSASERNRILGWWHVRRNDLTGDLRELEAAAPIYEALLEAEPGDASAAEALQHVYQTLGRQDDADDVVMRFATANPGSPSASLGMAQVHMRRGELQDSREITRRVLAMAASDAADHRGIGASGATPAQTSTATDLRTPRDDVLSWAHLWDAHAAWLANDPRGALAAADRARAGWRPEGSRARAQWGWYLASVYEGLGRFDSAESVIRELWAPEFRDRDLAHLAVLRGDLPEARALLAPHLRFEEAIHAATLLAWAGEFERAEWLEDQRRVRGINPPRRQSAVDEGVLRVAEGRYVETVQVLEPFLPSARLGTGIYLVLLESLATARSALNDRDGAIELLEPLTATRASVVIGDWDVYYWLRCRVLLAELYTEKGRAADAARVAGEVRQLLGVAAADHPPLVRLRTNCRC